MIHRYLHPRTRLTHEGAQSSKHLHPSLLEHTEQLRLLCYAHHLPPIDTPALALLPRLAPPLGTSLDTREEYEAQSSPASSDAAIWLTILSLELRRREHEQGRGTAFISTRFRS